MATIAVLVTDLMFQSRLREQAAALGHETVIAGSDGEVAQALGDAPALVVVDLHVAELDWRRAVAAAVKAGVPVLAFGRHTEAGLLRDAREAGCDRVVPRSQLVEELPSLIQELARAG